MDTHEALAWPHPGLLFRVDGTSIGMGLGAALSNTADMEGDGLEDGVLIAQGSSQAWLLFSLFDPAYSTTSSSDPGRSVVDNSIRVDTGQPGTRIQAALGDLDLDGKAEMVLGLPGYEPGGALIFYSGLTPGQGELTLADARWIIEGVPGSQLGASLAFGHSGNGEVDALWVGAPGSGNGEVYRLTRGDLEAQMTQVMAVGDLGVVPLQARETGARLGTTVAEVGDLDLDGVPELAFGAPDTPAGGQVHVLLSTLGLSSSQVEDTLTLVADLPGAQAGTALAGGQDLTGDGLPELVIGAPGDGVQAGRVYLVTPALFGSGQVGPFSLNDVPAALTDEAPGLALGSALQVVPDLNLDGVGELLVGVPAGAGGAGVVALLLGSPSSGSASSLAQASWQFIGQTGEALGTSLGLQSTQYPELAWMGVPQAIVGSADSAGRVDAVDLSQLVSDGDGDGLTILAGDCDDTTPLRSPALTESCDGLDNDCDGAVPADEADLDEDGFLVCEGDCADADPARLPGQNEVCNGLDDNCDGQLLETESDGDGDGLASCQGDCVDTDPLIRPGLPERCNGLDDNCDYASLASEADADNDGYRICSDGAPADCDDSLPLVYPGADERCDGLDSDCSGAPGALEVDSDADGVLACGGQTAPDCDDSNPSVSPLLAESCDGLDTDCDGSLGTAEVDQDGDGVAACSWTGTPPDCDETDPTVYPGAVELCDGLDNNCNQSVPEQETDADQDGYRLCASDTLLGDCNDSNAFIHPGATEICDGEDSNCDGSTDVDLDGDGFLSCSNPGHPEQTDCDDSDPQIAPGAEERCDGIDSNCDGVVPANELDDDQDGAPTCAGDCNDSSAAQSPLLEEACDGIDNNCDGTVPANELDNDQDGYRGCASSTVPADCNDQSAAVSPGASESCDLEDDDCDGVVDDGVQKVFYPDSDGDGYGDPTQPLYACTIPASGYVTNKGDCDDTNAAISPDAVEICDGRDTNCDTVIGQSEIQDNDSDGFSQCLGDCNDNDAAINPDAEEVMDTIDNNCDQVIDDVPCVDLDGDDFPAEACQGSTLLDCNDSSSEMYPGASEGQAAPGVDWLQGDGLDNDCDGTIDENTDRTDDDGDGITELQGDCNDHNDQIYPGQLEVPFDGIDNDCSGGVDEDPPFMDSDGDGYAELASDGSVVDCDDTNFFIHPGQGEDPTTAFDDNCDGILTVPPIDADADGIPAESDCNDANPAILPGAEELADGIDNNCNGDIDEGLPDGPGIGCGALSTTAGVSVACSVAAREGGGSSSLVSLMGLLGLAVLTARRGRLAPPRALPFRLAQDRSRRSEPPREV